MAIVEAQPKTDFERMKEIFATISISDVQPILLASINSMRDFGAFIEGIGRLQKKSSEAYDLINAMGENQELVILQFIDRIPEDRLKAMIEFSLKLSSIQDELKNFKDLNADKKIELGMKMKNLTENLSKAIEALPK